MYSGYASLYFGITGAIPFNQTNIISPSFIAVIGGVALIGFSIQELFRKNGNSH